MNRLDHVRPRQHQQVVVALEVARVAGEPLAAEVGLPEPAALDHRAHGAVEDQDAFAQRRVQARAHVVTLHVMRIHDPLDDGGPGA